ncbi:pyroglutamyl-peptidase I [Saxibacter everestensis]|uniref:Pyroglutamyl-peptidase I n=1 Tax=Saxibacter everestensis TaxID=2909229 RepID=A0ABY8QW36_9MICO|nr:pyroglutamyl-peptidase I [Brevibacteriaceae bacterium ZFBP1038]
MTGFEPFDGESSNPSWDAVRQAAAIWDRPEPLVTARLPCVFTRSAEALRGLLQEHRPDVVICVGQAAGRSDVTPERVAINIDDARIPDNSGEQPVDEPVVPDAPTAYFSTLPIKAAVSAMRSAGVPASVSQSAGTFVCNHVFYQLMHMVAGPDEADRRQIGNGVEAPTGIRAGFVHVPNSIEQAAGSGKPGLGIDVMATGLIETALAALTVEADLRIAGGAEY